jgi:hypothetical protein
VADFPRVAHAEGDAAGANTTTSAIVKKTKILKWPLLLSGFKSTVPKLRPWKKPLLLFQA